jgi:hypothetical protein
MKTLTIAAACLAGGVALGATSGVVAGDLITGKDIKNNSITGKDIKKGSVPTDRITISGDISLIGTSSFSISPVTLDTVTAAWQEGPELGTFSADKVSYSDLSVMISSDFAASGGACQFQVRIGGSPTGTIIGVSNGVKSPRDAASGLATGRRQHLPLKVSIWYRGTATSCVIGSDVNPPNGFLSYHKIEY